MASSSGVSKSPLPVTETSSKSHPYPPPLAKYEDLIASPELFMSTLKWLHACLRTKFNIPIIGGKDLDLHRLFAEVTARGGLEKIIKQRRWKEVTAVFDFPATATNASFVLRKHYFSLLYHFEQIYFFNAREYSPNVAASLQSPHSWQQLSDNQEPMILQSPLNTSELPSGSSSGNFVTGVIDGKFESGYLVTVSMGSESLKGVLYQLPPDQVEPVAHGVGSGGQDITPVPPVVHRRRRRKKSEIKRRDPAHPKSNRSGYNFFFAEQHARLKPLHPGKDREISRMIGELWNKLKDSERTVYQDQAMRDKERYRAEMEVYRERLRTGQVIRDAVPLQQCLSELQVNMEVERDQKTEEAENVDSPQTPSGESSSSKCGSEDDQMVEDSDEDTTQRNINVEMPAKKPGFKAPRMEEKELEARDESIRNAVPLQQCLSELQVNMEVERDQKTEEAENVDSPQTPSGESSSSKCGSEDDQMVEDSDEDTTQRNINVEMPAEKPDFEAPRMEEKELEARDESMRVPTAMKEESKGTDEPWDLSL